MRKFRELRHDVGNKRKKSEINLADDLELSRISEDWHTRTREMMAKHRKMWDGSLVLINIAQHRIDLKENTSQISQQPYRTGPQASKFVAKRVQRMLKDEIIQPSKS